jgi:hypothetical protein
MPASSQPPTVLGTSLSTCPRPHAGKHPQNAPGDTFIYQRRWSRVAADDTVLGVITGDTVTGRAAEAQEVFNKLEAVGVDLTDVFIVLENEGVEKFEKSWQELLDATKAQLDAAAKWPQVHPPLSRKRG